VLSALITFAIAGALVVLIPGPDTLVVLRSALVGNRRQGARTALGVLCGLAIWIAGAALGVTALLRASHDGYLVLRLAGAVYLLWFGLQALRSRALANPIAQATAPRSLVGRGFRAGLLTDLLNPKVGVFFITFLPAFIPRGVPVMAFTFGLGLIFLAETALYFATLLLCLSRLTKWLAAEKVRRRLNRATGLVLVGFGAKLAAGG
jgi:threonine/homoserine/homoserine lactone efflux protein